MLSEWRRRILSLVAPLSWADLNGTATRRMLVAWAEVLEDVAAEMRAKAEGRR